MTPLQKVEQLIQQDAGDRGLARKTNNLITCSKGGLEGAVHELTDGFKAGVIIFTGFTIPNATPPAPETDGPPGALFLAHSLIELGYRPLLVTEANGLACLQAGLSHLGIQSKVAVMESPVPDDPNYAEKILEKAEKLVGTISHLIAIEKCGPSHNLDTIQPIEKIGYIEQTEPNERGQTLTMSCRNITAINAPVHKLFDPIFAKKHQLTTIGIGDGGNEIGMGNIPWQVIADNINHGSRIACSTKTNHLIVAGVSNWGAYALGALAVHTKHKNLSQILNMHAEEKLIDTMVREGKLVDGRKGIPDNSVDGLDWKVHANVIRTIGQILEAV